jgi:hypothetical protein
MHPVRPCTRLAAPILAIALFAAFPETGSGGDPSTDPPDRIRDYTLVLRSGRVTPDEGIAPELGAAFGAGARRHVVIQFERIPGESDIDLMRSNGVILLDYLPNHAYFALVSEAALSRLAETDIFRAALPIRSEDKMLARLRNRGPSDHARNDDGTARVVVVLFGDVWIDDALVTARSFGEVTATRHDESTLEMNVDADRIAALADEEMVQWIEEAPPPKQVFLDDLRATVKADTVQAPPYGLDGSGAVFGQWEGGSPATTHEDFLGRLTIADGAPPGDHATAVAGIMAGDGSRSESWGGTPYQWRGIATAAEIVSYSWPSYVWELNQETAEAIAEYGIMASSNSWGWFVCGSLCSFFGDYDDFSKRYDRIVRGSQGAAINVVFAAGNDQSCFECQDSLPHFPYGTVSAPGASAKNTIGVGGVNVIDKTMTTFSGWGPVDDGRVKPDLMAPGCKGDTGVYVPQRPNDYADGGCGTSYSAPAVTGALGIMKQQFGLLGYDPVAPHTYKAVLIETAEDLGNPGPDYAFGHGHLDIQAAVDFIIANHPEGQLIRVDSLADSETDRYSMEIEPGADSLRLALVWDDFRGTPGAGKQLVNDLDLVARSPGGLWHHPYVLDPDDPSAVATTGVNDVDNVEVLELTSPETGVWTVEVRGSVVPQGPQEYTLALPRGNVATRVAESDRGTAGFRRLVVTPNPFGSAATIRFALPVAGTVRLTVHDVAGRRIATLVEGRYPVGEFAAVWNGVDRAGRPVSSGVYFIRIAAGGETRTEKVVRVRR